MMSRGVLIFLGIAVALIDGSSLLILKVKNYETGTPESSKDLALAPGCENNDGTNLWKIDTSPPTFLFGAIASLDFENIIEFVSSNTKAAFLSSDEIVFPSTNEKRKKSSVKAPKSKETQIKDMISPDLYGRLVGKIYEFSKDDLHARALLMTMSQAEATGFVIYFCKLVEQITNENMTKFDPENFKIPRPLLLGLETWARDFNKTVTPLMESRKIKLPARFMEFMLNEVLDKMEPGYTDSETAIEALMIEKYKCAEFNATNSVYNLLNGFDASGERLKTAEALNRWWADDINARNKVFAEKVKQMLMSTDGKRRFIAVDISHLAGPYGSVIDLLEEEGFKIDRVKVSEPLSKVLF